MNILHRAVRSSRPKAIRWFPLGLGILLSFTAAADSTTLSIGDTSATISSGVAGALNFTITRSGDQSYDVALDLATQDGSAVAGTDYTSTSGSVIIPAGTASATVDVSVPAHSGVSGDKTFKLNVSGAIGLGPTPSLAALSLFSTGEGPCALASADLNGDGKIDVISANGTGDSISVLLNNSSTGASTSSFLPKQNFATSAPRSIAVGDINGDGRPDLIVANLNSTTVTVFLNTTVPGSSTVSFAAAKSFATQAGAYSVAIGDINGDGLPDIVVANNTANTVSALINTTLPGSAVASFASQVSFAVGGGPRSVAISDLNGDGKLDLVVANNTSDSVSVLINTATPGAAAPAFSAQTQFAVGGAPVSVAVTDANVDGKPDLVVANNSSSTVSVLLNTTLSGAVASTFLPRQDYAAGSHPLSVVASDLNGDGLADILVTGADQQTVSVLQNATASGIAFSRFAGPTPFIVSGTPFAVAALDINGDGRADVVSANLSGNSVSVLLNNTAISSSAFNVLPLQSFGTGNSPYSIAYGDFNGDGLLDLVVTNRPDNTVSILLNTTPAGSFTSSYTAQKTYAVGRSPLGVAVGDINHDGRPDIVFTNANDNNVGVLINQTTPGSLTAAFVSQQTFATANGPFAVALADVNGDGFLDLLVADAESATSGVSVLINVTNPNSSTANFQAQDFYATDSGPESIAVGDFNGDGRIDVAVANYGANTVSVLLNNTAAGAATSTFAAQKTFAVGNVPQAMAVGDVNGDGKPDLLVANYQSSSVSVLLNTTVPGANTPAFSSQQTFATDVNPVSIALADLNGDGRIDMVTADLNSNHLSVFLNTTAAGAATPTFSPKQIIDAGPIRPLAVAVADVNRDGRPDLLAAQDGNTVSVLLGKQYQVALAPASATGTIHFVNNTVPMPFSFGDKTGVARNSQIMSDTVMIAGISGTVPVTVTGGGYSIGCNGVFTTDAGSISNGQTLCLQLLSSANFSTSTTMTVNVGGGSATFTVTTAAADTTPDAFSFAPLGNVGPSALATSAPVTIAGINSSAAIAVTGGSYSINDGAFTSLPGTINNGDMLRLQLTASDLYSTQTTAQVSVGGVSAAFNVTTLAVASSKKGGGAIEWQMLLALGLLIAIRRWRAVPGFV